MSSSCLCYCLFPWPFKAKILKWPFIARVFSSTQAAWRRQWKSQQCKDSSIVHLTHRLCLGKSSPNFCREQSIIIPICNQIGYSPSNYTFFIWALLALLKPSSSFPSFLKDFPLLVLAKPTDYMSLTTDLFWFLNHLCNISFHWSPVGPS